MQNPIAQRSRRGDRVKMLCWDRDSFTLYYRRLKEGTFRFPAATDANARSVEVSVQELSLLLGGKMPAEPAKEEERGPFSRCSTCGHAQALGCRLCEKGTKAKIWHTLPGPSDFTKTDGLLRNGKADGPVLAKLDGLTRLVTDWQYLIDDYFDDKAGRQLFSVADSIDTRTATIMHGLPTHQVGCQESTDQDTEPSSRSS